MTGHNSDSPTNPPAAEAAYDKVRRLRGDPPEGADARLKLGELPAGVDVRAKLGELPAGVDVRTKLGELPAGVDVRAKLGELPAGVDVRTKLGELPAGVDVRTRLGELPAVSADGYLEALGLLREPEPSGFDKAAAVLGDFLPPKLPACSGPEICAAVRRHQDKAVAADALPDGPEHDVALLDASFAFGAVALMPAADVLGVAAKLALLLRDLTTEESAVEQQLDLLTAAIADLLAIGGAAPREPTAEGPGQGGAV